MFAFVCPVVLRGFNQSSERFLLKFLLGRAAGKLKFHSGGCLKNLDLVWPCLSGQLAVSSSDPLGPLPLGKPSQKPSLGCLGSPMEKWVTAKMCAAEG